MKYLRMMTKKVSLPARAAAPGAGISAFLARGTALVLALIILTGASVWEGSAALAPRGELPEDGYYVATNSFPQNTVVDITNLETGQSVRAVVSSGLNTPGLLAVLSPDTANRIGLTAKTIGRIRMTQPQDPIAFSRFTEGLVASGDPDYDPQAMLAGDEAAEKAAEKAAAERAAAEPPSVPMPRRNVPDSPDRSAAEPDRGAAEPDRSATEPAPPAPRSDIPRGVEYSHYAAYSHGSIVDMASSPGPEPVTEDDRDEDWDDLAYAPSPPDDADSPERTNYPVWEQGGSVGIPEQAPADPWTRAWESDSPVPPPPGEADYVLIPSELRPPVRQTPEVLPAGPAAPYPAPYLDESLFIDPIEKGRAAEAVRQTEEQRAAEAARRAEEQRAAEATRWAEVPAPAPQALVQTLEEVREPLGPWVDPLPPEAPAPPALVQTLEEAEKTPGLWIDPLPPEAPAPPALTQTSEKAEELPGLWIDPLPPEAPVPALTQTSEKAEELPGPWVDPLPPEAPPPRVLVQTPEDGQAGIFSVPVNIISELEKGKYYLQLGAYQNIASVESALLRLDPRYPLNVQNAGTADKPVYRLLVGPVNLGESGALIQRFKVRGYRDAYIRAN